MKEEFKNEVAEEFEATEEMNIEVAEGETDEATEQVETEPEEFKPMLIGEPNRPGQLEAEDAYCVLLELLNELKPAIQKAILPGTDDSLAVPHTLFEFIKSENPEIWLIRQYIELNNISFPGMDVERIIELGLVKVEHTPELLNLHQRILKAIELVKKRGFYYPVGRLFNGLTNKFEFHNGFFEEVEKRFCRQTQSEAQNQIVIIFTDLCAVLNELHRLNILRGKNGPGELTLLDSFIDVMKLEPEEPFVVKDTLFYTQRLYNYRVKGVQLRNPVTPDKILS